MFISSVRYLCGTYILTEDEHFGSFLFEVSFYTIIRTLSETNTPDLYAHLAAGMRENSVIELWPANINRHLMKQKHTDFMKNR